MIHAGQSILSAIARTLAVVTLVAACGLVPLAIAIAETPAPAPLLSTQDPAVDWWFVFKFNASDFPGCGAPAVARTCSFDDRLTPPAYPGGFGQQFVFASSADPHLVKGGGCAGETHTDPLGATFGHVFNGPSYFYLVWNDQPKGHPSIAGCTAGKDCASPWGHAKGLLAWNEAGKGLLLQVTTPSWPLAASRNSPRQGDANTLGCVADDDVKLSQHFFALRLTHPDLVAVLKGLQNASVGTDPAQLQLVRNGGPADVQSLVGALGKKSKGSTVVRAKLSSGVEMIAKPSALHVPPWQMVSALLGGVSLRTATFWDSPKIATTHQGEVVDCWDASLKQPGGVEIALTGQWHGKSIKLSSGGNHAKLGVAIDPASALVVFGDENQQGSLTDKCQRSQNGRGGLFFVLENKALADDVRSLLRGTTAPGAL
jgi:hypothetical protein